MSKQNSIYFPNINSIRFIAAILVIFGHINMIQDMYHWPSHINNPFIVESGKLGVVLFFVLSGFLITYLLFKEKELTQTISIKNFYIRRILRIWPLYFMIVFLSLFILPQFHLFTLPGYDKQVIYSHFFVKLGLYVFILPNLVMSIFGNIPYVNQAWSIGAEEQFYLIWPWFMKKFNNKLLFMTLVIIIYGAIKFTLNHFASHDQKYSNSLLDVANRFWGDTPIDCMAIGGIFSFIGYKNNRQTIAIKKVLFNKWLQFAVIIFTLFLVVRGVYIPHVQHECFSILFGIIIINLALNDKNILNLEYPFLNYLGKISYGLYMYHTIVIVFSFKLLLMLHCCKDIYLYPMVAALTILVAGISYRFFEKPFISMKIRFSKVISGENAETPKHHSDSV